MRVVKLILKSLLALVLVLTLVVAVLWAFPGIVINRASIFPILRMVAGDITGTAERVNFAVRGPLGKAIGLTLRDVCWKNEQNRICAKHFEFDGEVYPFKEQMIRIQKIIASGGLVDWTVAKSEGEKTNQPTNKDLVPSPPRIMDRISVDHADLAVDAAKINLPTAFLKGNARLTGEIVDKARWKLFAGVSYQDREKPHSPEYDAEINASLQSPHALWRGPFETVLTIKGNLPESSKVAIDLDGNIARKRIEVRGKIALTKGKNKIGTGLKLLLTANTLDITASGSANGSIPHLPRLRWDDCHARYHSDEKRKAKLDLTCPVAFTGGFCEFEGGICEEVFKSTNATISSHLIFQPDKNKEQTVSGNVDLKIDSLFRRVQEGSASVSCNVDGKINEFPKNMKFNTKVDINVARFQKVVGLLRQRPWSVPAPFNTLDGTINLHLDAEGNLIQEGGEVPIVVSTHLTSPNQSLKTAGAGRLTITKDASGKMKSHLDFTFSLDDVKIALPKLSPSKPLRAFPDSRFTSKSEREVAKEEAVAQNDPPSFTYDVKIESSDKPVQVLSNLSSVPIPITVRLNLQSAEAPHGLVRISSFPVELFRRKATIEYLDLQLKADARYNEIKGRIVVKYSDYTVFISMMGLASAPQIHFQSQPPLPEDQVLAVLLFGKKPESLTVDQASSVGNTRAAVQNNALNLASMYLLASTPVESIGYDPITGSFNAKIKLRDGTSVTVGTDFSQLNQLGFRQRLGSNWAINTYVNDPFAVINRSLTALLEWSVGY